MGIIKFNKTEKDKNKEAVMQTKTVGTSAEQLEAEQTALKAKDERQNNSTFDDGFLEEVVDGRNTNTLVYRRNDRTKREIISATPLHYFKDSAGKYAVIDNTLTDKGDVIENSSNSFIVSFDKSLAGGKIFDLKKGEKAVSLYSANFSQKEKHSVSCRCELCAEDNSVTFKSSDQTEIQYKVLSDRIKENIVVNDKQDSYEYLFLMDIGGLSVEEDNGSILLKDIDNGETQFIIPSPYMYDAKQIRSNAVTYEVEADDGQLIIKVIADAAFINAADRAFPVIIDPQIVFVGETYFDCLAVGNAGGSSEDDMEYGSLIVEGSNQYGTYTYQSYLTIFASKISIDRQNLISAHLKLTAKPGAKGHFLLEQKLPVQELMFEAKEGEYLIDIKDKLLLGEDFDYRLGPDVYNYSDDTRIEFYTSGDNGPKIILEYLEAEQDPTIDEIHFLNFARGYLILNDGTFTVAIDLMSLSDFAVPLTLTNYHRLGYALENTGRDWRLNLNKQLKVSEEDSEKNTVYLYRDSMGDYHNLKEVYYFISNGRRTFINKDYISIELNGELTYNGNKVYKYSVCDGYTLIPEINDFVNSEFIEQRQNAQIQLEETLNSYAPLLKSYVKVYVDTGKIFSNLNALTPIFYRSLISNVNDTSNLIIMTESEALQLQSLYSGCDQIKVQIKQANQQIKEFNSLLENYEKNDNQTAKGDPEGYANAKDNKQICEDQKANLNAQEILVNLQIATLIDQARKNFSQVKNAFINYFKKEAELKLLRSQTPVNFLQDNNGIYSGFNSDGNLVVMFDAYGNYVSVEYDPFNRIAGVCDNKNKTIAFNYNSDGLLASITDNRGRTVKYNYDQTKLSSIIYADGSSLKFKYSSNRIASIDSDDTQWKMSYTDGKFTRLLVKNLSPVSKTISDTNVTYADKQTTIRYENDETETYSFDELRYLISHKKTDGAKFNEVTNYSYTKYAGGRTVKTESSSDREYGAVSETVEYDNLDIPVSKTTDWHWISDTVRIKSQTFYSYDIYNKLVKETTTEYIENAGVETQKVYVTNYCYNPQGSLVLTESFIEDEILTSGKNVEEKVYDEKGYLVKTISYNTLDSSSKFYSESEVTESGQLTADKDETGAICAEYEYAAGTNLVNSVTYPNGSKFAYARNYYNDKITSVTQSTDDGEANTTDIVYEHGLPVKVKSGSTAIEYTYDAKGRKASVTVNGKLLSEYGYEDYKKESVDQIYYFKNSHVFHADEADIKFVNQSVGAIDGDYNKMEIRETLTVSGGSFNGTLWSKHYTADGNLNNIAYKSEVEKNVQYEYDSFRRLTQAETRSSGVTEMTESFTYNGFGDVTQKSITGEVNQTYTYAYKNNAARDLDYISFDGYTFKPLTDCYGRNTGKEIYDGESKVAAEYISYRKVGDHATTMPSTVWFATGADINECIKYKYDKCGNISEIIENGHTVARYKYDALNRLIREDNKELNKTELFSYDNNGNITERCKYPYTTKDGDELAEKDCIHYEYRYDGDKLIDYQGEVSEYNGIGNPIIYKDKVVIWQNGTQLKEFDGERFVYDGLGRRVKKNDIEFTYDSDGRLIKQSNGLEFIYDNSGLAGVKYNGETYFYRKDVQGNIIAILDSTGVIMIKYIYDAWGNFTLEQNANCSKDARELEYLNPYRYRGYYYDIETNLYYLQTRYYDPEVGRFISQDSIDYADPETINGLNLYAYCGNNPVMAVDPDGTMPKWLKWLIAGVTTVALVVGAVALTIVSGGIASPTLAFAAQFGASILTGAAVGATLSLSTQAITTTDGDIDLGTFFIDVGVGAVSGAISFGAGQIFSAVGGGVGSYLNQITIKGLKVGRVFGNALPVVFGKIGSVSGGIAAGMFIDNHANILFNKRDSIQKRFYNNLQGGIFSNILDLIKYLW